MTMPNYVSRQDALALIVEQHSREILSAAQTQSVAMQTFRTITMGSSQLKIALLDAFPQAQWLTPAMSAPVNPTDVDVAAKPVTDMAWDFQEMFAEEAAAIVIVPENVIDDAEIDLWSEIEKRTSEAVARLIDQTVFFGTAPVGGVPATFPAGGIHGQAVAADHDIDPAAFPDADQAELWNQAMALVEADGYDVSAGYAARGIRASLRGMRDANGTPLYVTNLAGGGPTDSMYGVPIHYVTNGSWDNTRSMAILGDPRYAVLGVRQRLTAKRLDQATIGTFNLAERDSLALRVKTRLAFAILAPKMLGQSGTPFPFATILPKPPPVP